MNIFKNNHANQRYFERVGTDISKKEIANAIDNKNLQFFIRHSQSRSSAYILLKSNEVVKAVLTKIKNTKKRQVVTFLPWKDKYKEVVSIFHSQYGHVDVFLYPDCFIETGKYNALTKVFVKNASSESLEPMNPLFKECFNMAWKEYETKKNTIKK